MDLKVLNKLSYGMYVIATKYNDKNVGCFVNTVTQITSQNPIISVSVNKDNIENAVLDFKEKVKIYDGKYSNIKITTPEDIEIARKYLE